MTTTDSNNAPETYELPPEPPIGSRVRDHSGREWVRDASIGWKSEDESRMTVVGWALLMGYHGPLVRIPDPEPDPWPTAPLIVWTVNGDRGLFQRRALDEYVATINGQVVEEGDGNTVSDPIPVTIVPVAEWESVRDAWRAHSGVAANLQALLAVTDALGLDQ